MKVDFTDFKRVSFDDIELGQCFMYADALYMRTQTKHLVNGVVNSVCLETGALTFFEACSEEDNDGYVTCVDAKVVVSISTVGGEKHGD